jgi:hypothetical protein
MTEALPQPRVLVELAHESFASNRLAEKRDARRQRQAVVTATRRVNNALHGLVSNRYFESVPLDTVNALLQTYGFKELEPTLLCGREGRLHEAVGNNRWLCLTWYKMESGRYEVDAYVS